MNEPSIEAVTHGDVLGECATWCTASSRLWWIDLYRPTLRCWDPAANEIIDRPLPGQTLGSFALRDVASLLMTVDNRIVLLDLATGRLDPVAAPERERGEDRRFNDGRCDRQGRFWVGSMHRSGDEPVGALYRLDGDRSCTELLDGVRVPNAGAFSPDGTVHYFSDSRTHVIEAHDIDVDTGSIVARRTLVDLDHLPGQPDGSCVDADGCLWNAVYRAGCLVRITPQGRIDRTVTLPVSNPTSCTFGGDRLDVLFVTTGSSGYDDEALRAQPLAGSLLALDVGVGGVAEPAWAG